MKNYYQTLGIERAASLDEIKQAYRKLALKFHPDKNNGDTFFEERFKQIQEAYEVLSDPYEKGKYDNDFDRFFYGRQFEHNNPSWYTGKEEKKKEPKADTESEQRKNDERERQKKEENEKKRVKEIKRKAVITFEDKAWITIGSCMTMGILGIVMFFNYLSLGYNKKANQVCVASIVGMVVLILLSLFVTLIKSENGYR